jgi:DNA polymerase
MGARKEALLELWSEIRECTTCDISKFALNKVFGDGTVQADIMLVGEAPGIDEDKTGNPFVGHAGGILTACLLEAGLNRPDLFICNILKCHPPKKVYPVSGNRTPTIEEMASCRPYLMRQIEIVQPKVIMALGTTAMMGIFQIEKRPKAFRKEWFGTQRTLETVSRSIPVIITMHPQYLGYNASDYDLRKQYIDVFRRVNQWLKAG